MFTSVIDKQKRSAHLRKTAIVYLAVTVFCVIFDRVYAIFGHGVFSASMSFMFLYPLIAGALPFSLMWLFSPKMTRIKYYRLFYNCYNSGIATLITASMLNGIFEIAGTSSPYTIVFTVVGWSLFSFGLVAFLLNFYNRE